MNSEDRFETVADFNTFMVEEASTTSMDFLVHLFEQEKAKDNRLGITERLAQYISNRMKEETYKGLME